MGAYAPSGTLTDLNIIIRQIGWLKRAIQRNAMTSAKTISALIEAELDTIDTLIQGADGMDDLSTSPTLSLNFDLNPDFGIANSDGSAGPDVVVITGKP